MVNLKLQVNKLDKNVDKELWITKIGKKKKILERWKNKIATVTYLFGIFYFRKIRYVVWRKI